MTIRDFHYSELLVTQNINKFLSHDTCYTQNFYNVKKFI
jgi:hypothetical protein